MPISPNEFRAALSRFASGVTVVTTRDAAGKPHGITVSAFCSVSLEPPLVLVCIEKTAVSHRAFGESGAFVVNMLSDEQIDHSKQFASPALDKFDEINHRPGIGGIPVLDDTLASLECRLTNIHDSGDHTIFVGQVENATIRTGKPLLYFHGNYRAMEDMLSEEAVSE